MSGMPSRSFEASVTKDSLVFSAAHFITFNGDICERLHGHNWRLNVSVNGELDENHYVFDFIALRNACQNLCEQLDHSVLLPASHPSIDVTESSIDREVTAKFANRRWVFPVEDVRILPIANTTAELIGRWISDQLIDVLDLKNVPNARELVVQVEENFGQWATVRSAL